MNANIKFMWNGIKINGELYRGSWYKGEYTATSGIPKGTLTMYARDYRSIPRVAGLNINNETEILTDYFETDTIRIEPDSKYYAEAIEAWKKQEEHNNKRFNKRMGV